MCTYLKYKIIGVLFVGLISFIYISVLPIQVFAQSADAVAKREAQLRSDLADIEKDIAGWQKILDDTKADTASLQNDVSVLSAKIAQAKLSIKAKNIEIEQLSRDINLRSLKIADLEAQIEKGHESLGQLLRKTAEIDTYSLIETVLSNQNLSDFFSDIDSFDSIKKSLKDLFVQIREVEAKTKTEKELLAQKKDKASDTKASIESVQRQVQKNEAEKKSLLNVSKTKEKSYEEVLKDRQDKAAAIRSALFALRDSASIPFGTALNYALDVEKKTGVRAAFLLAIVTQESNLGENQGSCLLSNIDTGNGVGKNTGTPFEQIMKAPRDTVPFKNITERLGRDWKMSPVSCPPGYKYYSGRGFGGGMGPSQFIPSTWELFKKRIGSELGISADKADPWNPQHAFAATGIYMSDLGASGGSYTAERNAACRYYSGSACKPGRIPANTPYGDSVMKIAQSIQENMIDPLKDL